MAKQRFLNNFTSTFIAAVKDAPSSGTPETELDYGVLRISDGAAGSLINPTDGDYYLLTAFKRSGSVESNIEVMRVTAVDNSTPGECRITVQRAQEGTSAKAFVAGDYLSLRITKGTAENFSQPADLATKEPVIAAPVSAPTEKYWRGDKTWSDFFADVRAATLTGLSTAANAVVTATDTVLAAVGKLQAQVSAKFDKTGGDVNGNINFTGAGRRITGDFSNATHANRVLFQTSTANGNTVVSTLPKGSSTTSGFRAYGSDNLFDGVSADLIASIASGDVRLISNAYGTGTYLPLAFHTGGSERMRIDTSGSVGIGEAPSSQYKFQAANGNWCLHSDVGQLFIESSGRVNRWWIAANISDTVNDGVYIGRGGNGIGTGTKVLKILNDTTHINPNGGLGYGGGAGGTVVQATSKSTTVTLNKPTGQITMNNAALAAGASVTFQLSNNLITIVDALILTIDGYSITGIPTEKYSVSGSVIGSAAYITVKNISAGSLSEELRINFTIIKGATS